LRPARTFGLPHAYANRIVPLSAVAGLITLDDRLNAAQLVQRLTSCMTRRGPDARSHWSKDRIALGHCMLRTTPESIDEVQPTKSSDGHHIIVMDGRLDNLDELRRELSFDALLPMGTPDAEYVLAGYRRWGHGVARRLLGDFAFVIWDDVEKKLFCATDSMGAKTLWLTQTAQFIAIASSEEAFLSLPGIHFSPNAELIATLYLPALPVHTSEPRGWDKNALAIDPGQWLSVSRDGRMERDHYWPMVLPARSSFRDEDDAKTQFVAVFTEALRCRMRGNTAPAALMSGGMDSAAIAAFAPALIGASALGGLATFSLVSAPDEICIESDAIRAISRMGGIYPHLLEVPSLHGQNGFDVEHLQSLAWNQIHPVSGGLLLILVLGSIAQAGGHRVLLHGASGDIAAHCIQYYMAATMRRGSWRKGWRECALASQHHTYLYGHSAQRLFAQALAVAHVPLPLRRLRGERRARRASEERWDNSSPISSRLFSELSVGERMADEIRRQTRFDPADAQGAHLRAASDIRQGLMGYDRAAGQVGLEVRDPWADRRVVEFFLSLPTELKSSRGRTKHLPRTACAPLLPLEVPWRSDKTHVGWKLTHRLMLEERAAIVRRIGEYEGLLEPFLNVDRMRAHATRFSNSADPVAGDIMHETLMIARWMQQWSHLADS
jgi:asparagine synthase (glutamine-hydrolysing)